MFGFFTLDLICHKSEKTAKESVWVLDLDPYINDYTSSYFMFDILMNGSYFPDKNVYLVEN